MQKVSERSVLLILMAVAILFFATTNPANVPPVVFMIGFGLLLAIMYLVVRLLARVFRLRERLSPSKYGSLVFTATVLPVLLIAMQSLGQLSLRDVITLALLFGIGFFYASRLSGRS